MKWFEIIKKNYEEVFETCKTANRAAYERETSEFTVYIDTAGDVYTMEDTAGGNSIPMSVFEGNAEIVATFHRYGARDAFLSDYTEEDYKESVQDAGDENVLAVIKAYMQEEETDDFEQALRDCFLELYKEIQEIFIEAAMDQYFQEGLADDEAEYILDQRIEALEYMEE